MILYPHFPLEFAFLFYERIAFWLSDLLIRLAWPMVSTTDELDPAPRVGTMPGLMSFTPISSLRMRDVQKR